MSGRNVVRWGSLAIVLGAGTLAWALGARADREPEELLPAGAVLYARWDGSEEHAAAWQKTAAHAAVHDAGLDQLWEKVVTFARAQAPPEAKIDVVLGALSQTIAKGASLAVTLPEGGGPLPRMTFVLHEGGNLEPTLGGLLKQALERDLKFSQRQASGRTVTSAIVPNSPGVEIGWWVDGSHLVVVVGSAAVDAGIAVAAGEAPNITADPLWAKYAAAKPDFEVASAGWIDFARLRKTYGGLPLPPQAGRRLSVDDVLVALGLDGLNAVAVRSGYDGRTTRSDWTIDAPAPRRGLLALLDQQPISLDDLPPLPENVALFQASGFDWARFHETVLGVARDVVKLGPPEAVEHFDRTARSQTQAFGFDPRADLLDPLGNVTCFYADSGGGLFGFGFGLAVSVDDATRLRGTLDRLTERAIRAAEPDEATLLRTKVGDREMVSFEVGGGFVNPTYSVGQEWLIIGLSPQTVRAHLLREQGTLPQWSPKDHAEVLAFVPDEFTSLTYTDPKPGIDALVGMAPMLIGFGQAGMRQSREFGPDFRLPITAADVPPAELVTRSLFPNVSVTTTTESGLHVVSKSSLPAFPSVGGGGAAVPVLVALLLPAVQQARAAARRSQSMNNLKQTALALHNYHDANQQMPRGTIENADLEPEERLSWMVEILPYVEQQAVYQSIDRKKGWEDDANTQAVSVTIPAWINPAIADGGKGGGETHYVGISGYGPKSAELPLNDKRAGVFGYDRVIRFANITDGLSNTIGVAEASRKYGHWAAGGDATIRGFSKKPYFNGPDGIGGPFQGGGNYMLMDGSVRFISENVDPSILEGLSTIGGAEVIVLD